MEIPVFLQKNKKIPNKEQHKYSLSTGIKATEAGIRKCLDVAGVDLLAYQSNDGKNHSIAVDQPIWSLQVAYISLDYGACILNAKD